MISTQEIAELIKDPTLIKIDQLEDLETLMGKYPYSSTLFMLYCKGISKHKKIEFDEILKKTAAHSVDRERLQRLIEETESTPKTIETHVSTEEEKEKEIPVIEYVKADEKLTQTETNEEVIEQDEDETAQKDSAVESIEEKSEAEQELSEEESVEEFSSQEVSETEEPIEENEKESSLANVAEDGEEESEAEMDELDETILSSALGTAYEIAPDSVLSESEKVENFSLEESKKSESAEEENEVILTPPEDMSFVEWLRYKQKTHGIENKINRTQSERTESPKSEAEFFSPSKKAKESLEEQEDLVTETLAKIHIMQKNYGKAIEAYEQLSLLYPEKKAFFASQIEKINDTIR